MFSSAYVWAKILGYLEEQQGSVIVSTWFDDTEVVELTEDQLILHTSSDYRRDIIQQRYCDPIREAMQTVFHTDVKVIVLGDADYDAYRSKGKKTGALDFNPQYNFDNFVVGPSNRFAHGAALAVSNHPGDVYNPLFIYGRPGMGKTHLLYAIANAIRKKNPDANIVYIKGDQFTNELISAIQSGKNMEFRSKYREADLFLIDDVQFIAGKESTQEEFFHTFNTLYENHKQIVMTSDRKPSDMLTLEDRLKTRFEWGLLADIQPPDYETRMAIIKSKAFTMGMDLPEDAINFIAINITNNIRQIEGTVKKVLAYQELNDMPLDLNNISRAIADMYKNDANVMPTPSLIISQVSKFYGIDEMVLRGSQKSKGIAEARSVAMYLLRKLTNLSLPDIGCEFAKDHSTVLYNIRKVEKSLADGDTTLENNIRDLTSNINSLMG